MKDIKVPLSVSDIEYIQEYYRHNFFYNRPYGHYIYVSRISYIGDNKFIMDVQRKGKISKRYKLYLRPGRYSPKNLEWIKSSRKEYRCANAQ